MNKIVWTFTNQKELNKSQFIDYFERKVFRTIRKYDLLPKDKIFTLKKLTNLNTTVLKNILEKKFEVNWMPSSEGTCRSGTKPNLSSDNLSQLAEDIFKEVLKGNFKGKIPKNAPLAELSDKEIELYAQLTGTKGTKRKQDKKIQALFNKFLKKNQDLELNIVKAIGQLN
ncbi:MAG: hypothetical protein KKF50_00970 [Nanoarchaeota archaeon]|nr:hypothetical protein [Nanoarchaeota archaeon]